MAPRSDIDMNAIRISAVEHTRVALDNANYNREANARHLNESGRALRELKVGDYVKIYAPPSQGVAKRRDRKVKHLMQWRGPMLITAKPSSTHFHLSSVKSPGQTYERHITNVRRWVGEETVTEDSTEALVLPAEEAGEAPTYDVGDMVFAREDVGNASVDLGKVVSTTEGNLVLHCWGTRGATFKSAK